MARVASGTLPTVRSGVLTFPHARDGDGKNEADETAARPIAVDSLEWWAWLARDTSTQFCVEAGLLRFSARRKRRNGAWCWYASAPQQSEGGHHEVVLGATATLTLEQLERAAETLDQMGMGEVDGATVGATPTPTARAPGTRQLARGDRPRAPQSVPSVPSVSSADPRGLAADPTGLRGADTLRPSPQAVPPVPLLATKLFIPHPRLDLVPRPRLLAQLEAGLRGPVTLLSAPAGWGKTSLLSACIYKRDRGCFAKPSGKTVPGTALPGKGGVIEPPLPYCR